MVWRWQYIGALFGTIIAIGDELWTESALPDKFGRRKLIFFQLAAYDRGVDKIRTWSLVILWLHVRWAFNRSTNQEK